MFHPVGSQPPSVYWRRRLLAVGVLVIVIVLLAVTVSALTSSSSGSPSAGPSARPAADSSSSRPAPRSTASSHASSAGRPTTSPTGHASTSSSPTTSASGTASLPVEACRSSDLKVAAVVEQQTYHVGQDPMVGLQVTNVGPAPCAQNLADKEIVLKVYNGVSRVWGSHDCEVQPKPKVRTLAVGAPVLASVSWSGETSQPRCAGTRQHVGAGTYTLYASLSGETGTAARFTIN